MKLFVLVLLAAASAYAADKPAWTPTQCKSMTDAELKKKLTPEQYDVTKKEGTDKPFGEFKGQLVNNHEKGLFVDIICGQPLFTSNQKFDSGTGWPSFWAPISPDVITTKDDNSLFVTRTEVRSKLSDAHLGHVFDDGPKPTGLRYCMNSNALRFIPYSKLKAEGYGEYLKYFDKTPDQFPTPAASPTQK